MASQMDLIRPYTVMEAITLDAAIPVKTEALICTVAGTVVLQMDDGAGGTVNNTFTLSLNEILKFKPIQVVTGGTGTVKAIY